MRHECCSLAGVSRLMFILLTMSCWLYFGVVGCASAKAYGVQVVFVFWAGILIFGFIARAKRQIWNFELDI